MAGQMVEGQHPREVVGQGWQNPGHRVVLLVGPHVLHNAGHPADVLVGQRIRQLENVVLLGDANVLLDQAVAHLSALRQGDEQLLHLAGDLLEVIAEVFGEQLGRPGVNLALLGCDIAFDPLRQLVVADLVGLEHHAGLLDALHRRQPLVRHLVAVDQDQHRRCDGIVRVSRQFLELVLGLPLAQVLGLLDEDQAALGHHRKLPGRSQHLVEVAVPSVQDGLVEVAFVLLHRMGLDGIGEHVEVIGLLPAQQIERGELARLDGAEELLHPLHAQEKAGATWMSLLPLVWT